MTPPTTVGARSALVTLLAIGCTTAVPSAGAQVQQGRIAYPATKTIAHVDDYFGRKVADPYRWMEDLNSPGVGVGEIRKCRHGRLSREASAPRAFPNAHHRALELSQGQPAVPRGGAAVLHEEQRPSTSVG